MKKHSIDSDKLNSLRVYDPDQPRYIPKKCDKTHKRSVYFPRTKACLLYQVDEFIRESRRAGKRITLNDVLGDALELWLEKERNSYLRLLAYRLSHEKAEILSKLDSVEVDEKGQSFSDDEAKARYERIKNSLEEIGRSFKGLESPLKRSDIQKATLEIINALGKHCSEEIKRALPKVLNRSDVLELVKQVRHEPKIKKMDRIYRINKDEESDWYD